MNAALQEMQIHPAAEMFPMMDDGAFEALASDIKANGQREPIIVHDGAILDGRNRYRACLHVGIDPEFMDWSGTGDPIAFVVSMNLHRRHLNESQRAMIAAKLVNMRQGERTDIQRGPSEYIPKVSQVQAAKLLNVSDRSVRNAKTIIDDGNRQDIEAIERGNAAVTTTAKAIRRRENKPTATRNDGQPVGARVVIPGGHTPEQAVREGLALEAGGVSAAEIPARLNLSIESYRLMRDIVLVADRTDISKHDMGLAAVALEDMNRTRQVRRNHETIAGIVRRLWGDGKGFTSRQAAEAYRLESFDHALSTITQVCSAAPEIEIPYLNAEHAAAAILTIKTAEKNLHKLRIIIEGIHE